MYPATFARGCETRPPVDRIVYREFTKSVNRHGIAGSASNNALALAILWGVIDGSRFALSEIKGLTAS
jgi:hypothetical protein